MRRASAAALIVLLCSCGLLPEANDGRVAVMIVNGSAAEPMLRIDAGDGVDDLAVAACTAVVHVIPRGTSWTVRVDGEDVIGSGDVAVPAAGLTLVEVAIAPDGRVTVRPPRAVAEVPDAPGPFPCAGGPRSYDGNGGGLVVAGRLRAL